MEPASAAAGTIGIDPHSRGAMPKCETCGNDYDKAFQVIVKYA